MKNQLTGKSLLAAVALSCLVAFPASAAQTREEYRTESSAIRTEMKEVKEEISQLRKENNTIMINYRNISSGLKGKGQLPEGITDKEWKEAKELHQKISELRKAGSSDSEDTDEAAESADEQSETSDFKADIKNGDYDLALARLKGQLEARKETRDSLKEMNEIWKQIDDLLK